MRRLTRRLLVLGLIAILAKAWLDQSEMPSKDDQSRQLAPESSLRPPANPNRRSGNSANVGGNDSESVLTERQSR
jgi:hypothetical protein